jgi:hypothetical protein
MRVLALMTLISLQVSAAPPANLKHEASPEEYQNALHFNQQIHRQFSFSESKIARPVPDVTNFSYILMSAYDGNEDEVAALRESIAKNLPDGVKLVLLADKSDAAQIRNRYAKWISSDRIVVATDSDTENGFWARDAFPIPTYIDASENVNLVEANYYRPFDSQSVISKSVNAHSTTRENFVIVGGNIIADEDGVCFSVKSDRLFNLTESDLIRAYGCKTVHLMPYKHGLGDVDEVLKPLSGHRMLTNVPEYETDLTKWGYTVIRLPDLSKKFFYRTYANTLIVNGTAFMPTYGMPEDREATAVYEKLGYKVISIPSNVLSDNWHGSVHCQTMAYPDMNLKALLDSVNAVVAH